VAGAFLAAAVWGGHICIWGPRIPDDWAGVVIWHQLCNYVTLQPILWGGQSSHRGATPQNVHWAAGWVWSSLLSCLNWLVPSLGLEVNWQKTKAWALGSSEDEQSTVTV